MSRLLSVQEAQQQILAAIQVRPVVTVPIDKAFHHVLARSMHATHDQPSFSNSGMDGYAVRFADVQAAAQERPVILKVTQDIPAGSFPAHPLQAGQAARIMTGAPIPEGADVVVPVEDIFPADERGTPNEAPQQITITQRAVQGQYVRRKGQDVHQGQTILPAGKELHPQDIALLAAFGYAEVEVISRPKVCIFSSGDELVPPGGPLAPGKIYDSNQYFLAGLLADTGAEVIRLGSVPDNPDEVLDIFNRAVDAKADLIVSSAGVSVGAFDYVRQIMETHGNLDFWRVNMRPGKPVAFGNFKRIPFIGLPGNPASAFVGCLVFVLPVIRKQRGLSALEMERLLARIDEPLESDGRESYLRAVITRRDSELHATLSGHQGSGNLYALAQANALLIVPSGVKSLPAGSEVEAIPLAKMGL